jgi:hypothetical protein
MGQDTSNLNLIAPFLYTGPGASTDSSTSRYDKFGLQGIKGSGQGNPYYIVGTSGNSGTVYIGPIDHAMTTSGSGSGEWTVMNAVFTNVRHSNIAATSIYGVNPRLDGNVNLVGSWQDSSQTTANGKQNYRKGFYYQGPVTSQPDADDFSVVWPSNSDGIKATFTFLHSVSGDLAVGGYDLFDSSTDPETAIQAFLYDPASGKTSDIPYPGNYTTSTAYGIWHNGESSYTIAGGAALDSLMQSDGIGVGTLIDYDSITGQYSNFRTYSYNNINTLNELLQDKGLIDSDLPDDAALETHFEGIYFNGKDEYILPATITAEDKSIGIGAIAKVTRLNDGGFSDAQWSLFDIPGSVLSTNNSVYGDANIGFAIYPSTDGTIASSYAGLLS